MNTTYSSTHFRSDLTDWPASFAIITGYATTGESWPQQENDAADRSLQELLMAEDLLCGRVTGYSPDTGHAEPGWAAPIGWTEACDLGLQFKQDAIYYVDGDVLSVSYCDDRRKLVEVGPFRERLSRLSC